MSPRIDSGVKPCFSGANCLLDPKARDQNSHKNFVFLFLYMGLNHVNRWGKSFNDLGLKAWQFYRLR
jgi:hypothetical protein